MLHQNLNQAKQDNIYHILPNQICKHSQSSDK